MSEEIERVQDQGSLDQGPEILEGEVIHRLLVPILSSETYDEETLAAFRDRVDRAVEDAIACFQRRRQLVRYPFDSWAEEAEVIATVQSIARWGARLALGLDINPDRVGHV